MLKLQPRGGLAGLGSSAARAQPHVLQTLRIGACDWSLGKRSDPESFSIARALSLDGVQLDLGNNPSAFLEKERRETFQLAAARSGVEIASLALGMAGYVKRQLLDFQPDIIHIAVPDLLGHAALNLACGNCCAANS